MTSSSSSILWQNESKTVVLLDLPRSIEEAQVPSSELTTCKLRCLISSPPPASPFPTPEPKTGSGFGPPTAPAAAQVAELMTRAAVESALDELTASYTGVWCLPRITTASVSVSPSSSPSQQVGPVTTDTPDANHNNNDNLFIPRNSHPLQSPILTSRDLFLASTRPEQFHLILLDPPWPNRSARRKHQHQKQRRRYNQDDGHQSNNNTNHHHLAPKTNGSSSSSSYRPAPTHQSLRALLSSIPVASRLAPGGLVAVWVTNSPACLELLTGSGGGGSGGDGAGLFAEWGVEPVGEWVWLKVTSSGEPVVGLESCWRRPWERLVFARKRGASAGTSTGTSGSVRQKVIVAVPDVHSRKPNLRGLLEQEEGLLPARYEALEVFARSLTSGWWAWGDEVLKFQRREWWVREEAKEREEGANG
ncbi:hypothetical protein VTJ04DRAFT_4698 [Mycothermus thermophilus]|uniref:uncharacterized protein n=1 Tax=Humicola insolens TaxID=85995 RepID=UPI0037439DFF